MAHEQDCLIHQASLGENNTSTKRKSRTSPTTMEQYKKIVEQQNKLALKLKVLQEKCKHPTNYITKKHGASTGGWDENEYWTNFTCRACGHRWIEDGSK